MKPMRTAVIDADSIIHIVAYHNAVDNELIKLLEGTQEQKDEVILQMYQTKDTKAVLDHIDGFVNDILNTVGATHYLGFLGNRNGSETYRHKLAVTKPYKGQRGKSPHWTVYWKPIIIDHLVKNWGFIEVSEIEADDACGICVTHIPNSILCSPDKDLKQIPGEHYDYKKIEFDTVTKEQGLKNLFRQVLIGDSVDNIPGCPGVGEKSPLLNFPPMTKASEYSEYVQGIFKDKGHVKMFAEQLTLVHVLRNPRKEGNDMREIPTPIKRPVVGNSVAEMEQKTKVDLPPTPTSFSQ